MAVLSEEQSMLRDAAKSWVQEKSPVTAFRKMRDSGAELGYDAAAWNEMAEMGWAGVIIPEEYGGSNFGYLSLGLILEELGRTLTASPLLSSGLAAASALILGGSDAQKSEWLPKIAEGTAVGALAIDEGPHHNPSKVEATVSGGKLTGKKTFVLEGMAANVLIVSAKGPDGVGLFVVKADDAGVSRTRLHLADSRGAANIEFKGAAAEPLSGGAELIDKVLDRARAGVAAEMLGSALQAFETTLDYLKVRVQFGQVIGSFQALQHRGQDVHRPGTFEVSGRGRVGRHRLRQPRRAGAGVVGEGQDGRHLPPGLQRDGPDARRHRHDRRPRRGLLPEARPRGRSGVREPGVPSGPLRADPGVLGPGPRRRLAVS